MDQGGWLHQGLAVLRDMDGPTSLAVLLGVLGLCGLGLPMPEDVVLITAGWLASLGKFSPTTAIFAGLLGVLSGDAVLFFLGRTYGRALLRHRLAGWLFPQAGLDEAERRIRGNGRFICFIARFLPGLRSPIYFSAGALGIPPSTYLVQDGFAALISVPFWVAFGYAFGGRIETALDEARGVQAWILAGATLIVIGYALRRWRRPNATPSAEAPSAPAPKENPPREPADG